MEKVSKWDIHWKDENASDYWRRPEESVINFLKSLDNKKHTKVLDLGAGIGRHSLLFARNNFKVTALDASLEGIKDLKRQMEKEKLDIELVQDSYLNRIFKNDSFDIILSYNVIYHGTKEDMTKAITLSKDYLKPNGLFFFTCPSREDGKYGSGKEVSPHAYESLNSVHPGDIHYFSSDEDIKEFVKGLKLISLKKNERYWDNDGINQSSSYYEVIAQK